MDQSGWVCSVLEYIDCQNFRMLESQNAVCQNVQTQNVQVILGANVLYCISYDLSSEYLTFSAKVAFYIQEAILNNKVGALFPANISTVNNVYFLQLLWYILESDVPRTLPFKHRNTPNCDIC